MSIILNSLIDLVTETIPTWNMLISESRKAINKIEKQMEIELKSVEENTDFGEISNDLYLDISIIADGNKKIKEELMAKALVTERWIKYTFYYLTEENASLLVGDKETQELVNGICNLVLPKAELIYPKAKIGNLKKYDAEELLPGYNGNYILSIDDIQKRFTDDLREKAKKKFNIIDEPLADENETSEEIEIVEPKDIKNTTVQQVGRYDKDGYFHPVFLKDPSEIAQENETKSILKKPDFMSDDLYNKFEIAFSPIANDIKYYYNINAHGNWCINIVNGVSTYSYIIDDGSIMGGDYVYILGNINVGNHLDTLFVNASIFPKIASNIIHSAFYIMTAEECNTAQKALFTNSRIYRNIDFTNTKFLDKSSFGIEKSLSVCIGLINPDIRLRFENYLNKDNYTLVSDNTCKSPLYYTGATATSIVPGLKLIVDGNTITKLEGGNGTKYQF